VEPLRYKSLRCAIYTRKSSEEGLEQDFNSLQAQREACEAFIRSQHGEGWQLCKTRYDDGGLSAPPWNVRLSNDSEPYFFERYRKPSLSTLT